MRFLIAATLCACTSMPPPAMHDARQPPRNADPNAAACFAGPVMRERDLEARLRACDADACRFPIARAYFDEKVHRRAAPLLLQIAHGPKSALSARAAELAFESVAMIGRPECYDLLATELPKLLDEFCTPTPSVGAKMLCGMLYDADVEMTRCSECTVRSVSGRDPDVEQLTAARLFVDTALERCLFGQGNHMMIQIFNETRRCDELLDRASLLYDRGGSEMRSRWVWAMLMDPKNGLDQTKPALRAKEALRARELVTRTQRCP